MEFSPETIFISYSRADGRAFAEAFEQKLEHEAGIKSWRDLRSIEGGEDIRPQVLRAIERVKHLVLILSRRALASEWVKREWTHARMVGRKVSPILADPSIKRGDLPSWIQRIEVYDIAEPQRWRMLVRVLEGPGETRRVPYMSGDVPDDFVPRPAEYEKLKQAILSAGSGATVAVTTALLGAGGYGKTTLANQLCRDPDVRFEFTDGILRVEIGKERDDVTGLVTDLIETLDPEGNRPGFQNIQTAAEYLAERIGEARLLLVVDDVWREAQLRPFLRGGRSCVRLVTTRLPQVLPRSHVPIAVDEMRADEALSLIAANLPGADVPAARGRLAELGDRLGAWAQMLSIANGWLRSRIAAGESLPDAIGRLERRLETRGLTAFDARDEKQRHRAIGACVEASLEDLEKDELARLGELGVLPEDENVPLGVIEALWAESAGLNEDQSEDLILRFHALSLLQSLDLSARTLRLHDNMIWYLRDRIGVEDYAAANQAMAKAISMACKGEWATLSAQHAYGWRFLIRHLRAAGWHAEADRVLSDYIWINAKLHTSGPWELFGCYLPESEDDGVRLVGRAIALSLPALGGSHRELPRQLYGRLGAARHGIASLLVQTARQDANFRPAPRWPGLTPPGAERLRFTGHEGSVRTAAFFPDGTRILTSSTDGSARIWDATTGREITALHGYENAATRAAFSADGTRILTISAGTARIWDAITGREITTLRGHNDRVSTAVFSTDGTRIVSASDDQTARIWDAITGREITALHHEFGVRDAVFSPDGSRVITLSYDRIPRIWDVTRCREITILGGHEDAVTSASFSAEGNRILTASFDRTARIWDATTGREITVLIGHADGVTSASFSPEGTRVLTASGDQTARVWDATTGAEIAAQRGHERWVASAIFSPDGARVLTASGDQTARVWDSRTGKEINALRGHEDGVTSAVFSVDGTRILTASHDKTARLWDAAIGGEITIPRGHEHRVTSVVFSPSGARILTASVDGTARIWDATTGMEISVLGRHEQAVTSAAFSPDGSRILTASQDQTARLWDATTGTEIGALRGHENWVWSAVYSADGARVLTASADRTARIWDATTSQEITAVRGHSGGVMGAVFSPDGACILTASDDHTARIWDAKTGREIDLLRSFEYGVTSAVFSPDGTRVLAAADDQTVRIWDATRDLVTNREITTLRGHLDGVASASFSPDGTRIVTASEDRTVRIWDAATGHEITRIALDAAVTALAVRDGDIALGDALGRIHIFEAGEILGTKRTDS